MACMGKKYSAIILGLAMLSVSAVTFAAPQVSPNIPLNSYVYDYVAKLDGLGFLSEMRPGTQPYTRVQVAKWLVKIENAAGTKGAVPGYVRFMLNRLNEDLQPELVLLGGGVNPGVKLARARAEYVYNNINGVTQKLPNSKYPLTYQPMGINRSGYALDNGSNFNASLDVEGYLGKYIAMGITPRGDLTDNSKLSLERVYIKTRWNNTEFQLGKEALWWGQGVRGGSVLTNNAKSFTALRVTAVDPVQTGGIFKFLGKIQPQVLYAIMEKHRAFPNDKGVLQDADYPSFVGMRLDVMPNNNLNVGLAMNAIVGGKGRMLKGVDYWHFITGKNATTAESDKWNTIAGIDLRFRVPGWNNIEFYSEVYGEDQTTGRGFIPTPSQPNWIIGTYIPRLTKDGKWDLRLEGANTTKAWYSHWAYDRGYTYKDSLIGDAMGNNARRYYGQLNYYDNKANKWSLNVERVKLNRDLAAKPTVTSVWLSNTYYWRNKMSMQTSIGVAKVSQANKNTKDYMFSLALTKDF